MTTDRLEVLLHGCRKGDRICQREIYDYFYAVVLGVCSRYASNREEAKELVNDAFYKAFTKMDRYKSGTNFRGWLYTIARNTALDRYRVAIEQPRIVGEEAFPEGTMEHESQILNAMDANEKLAYVQYLPPAYRLVFNLYVVEQFTHEEIAEELGISIGASKSNLSKARAKLREFMENQLIFCLT